MVTSSCASERGDRMPERPAGICPVCELPDRDCVCCGCSHVCPRDQGETFCPVCLPEPVAPDAENGKNKSDSE